MMHFKTHSPEFLPLIVYSPNKVLVNYNRKQFYLVMADVKYLEPTLNKEITMTLRCVDDLENDDPILHGIIFNKINDDVAMYELEEVEQEQVTYHFGGKEVVVHKKIHLVMPGVERIPVKEFKPYPQFSPMQIIIETGKS